MDRKLIPPDDFTGDWFGWGKSQTAHIFVGVFLVFFLSATGFAVWGEFPVKRHMLAVIGLGYLAFKIHLQGWLGWETIEDWVFVVGYGAAGPLAVASEVQIGSMDISMSLEPMLPYFYVCTAHLIAGAAWRKYEQIKM